MDRSARGWFPKGTEDPELALIRVTIEDAEYWDAPNGKMVVLFAYAKAVLTGEKPGNIGEHARVDPDLSVAGRSAPRFRSADRRAVTRKTLAPV